VDCVSSSDSSGPTENILDGSVSTEVLSSAWTAIPSETDLMTGDALAEVLSSVWSDIASEREVLSGDASFAPIRLTEMELVPSDSSYQKTRVDILILLMKGDIHGYIECMAGNNEISHICHQATCIRRTEKRVGGQDTV